MCKPESIEEVEVSFNVIGAIMNKDFSRHFEDHMHHDFKWDRFPCWKLVYEMAKTQYEFLNGGKS